MAAMPAKNSAGQKISCHLPAVANNDQFLVSDSHCEYPIRVQTTDFILPNLKNTFHSVNRFIQIRTYAISIGI